MAQDIIAAGNEIPFLYAFDPSGILAANTTLYNNTLAQYSQIEFVRAMVNNIGLGSYLASICNTNSLSFITHSYNYNRALYLNTLAGINLPILQNMYAALIGTPWPGTGPAIAQLVGLPPGNVETWLNNNGGCGLVDQVIAFGMSTPDAINLMANFTVDIGGGVIINIIEITDIVLTSTNIIIALDDYDRNLLWDKMHATSPTPNLVLTALSTFSNFTTEAAKQYPAYVAPIQETYRSTHSMEAYFGQVATYYGQSLADSLLDTFAVLSDRFEDIYSLDEWHIYGNQRHGTDKIDSLKLVVVSFRGEYDSETGTYTPLVVGEDTIIATTVLTLNDSMYICKRGRKRYELSNHLGNVLVVISDKKLHECDTMQDTFVSYRAEVLAAQDYYPFGMLMPDRIWESDTTYRYGFNGQEQDNEVSGKGNSYTAEFWQYDSRLGRRFNVDPIFKSYESPYSCFGNNPVLNIDINGADSTIYFNFYSSGFTDYEKKQYVSEIKRLFEINGLYGFNFVETNQTYEQVLPYLNMTDQFVDFGVLPKTGDKGATGDFLETSFHSTINTTNMSLGPTKRDGQFRNLANTAFHEIMHGFINRSLLINEFNKTHDLAKVHLAEETLFRPGVDDGSHINGIVNIMMEGGVRAPFIPKYSYSETLTKDQTVLSNYYKVERLTSFDYSLVHNLMLPENNSIRHAFFGNLYELHYTNKSSSFEYQLKVKSQTIIPNNNIIK